MVGRVQALLQYSSGEPPAIDQQTWSSFQDGIIYNSALEAERERERKRDRERERVCMIA